MNRPANVRSLEAIRQSKTALIRFEEDAGAAMTSLRQEIIRTLEWLRLDRPAFWRTQKQKAHDRVAQARSQLDRKRIITVAGQKADCIEEEQELRRAKKMLETAEEKIEIVRRWSIKVQRASDEYTSRIAQMDRVLQHDVPRMIAQLERMLAALESYVSIPATGSASATAPDSSAANENSPPAGGAAE
jgi:hypothetical protein